MIKLPEKILFSGKQDKYFLPERPHPFLKE